MNTISQYRRIHTRSNSAFIEPYVPSVFRGERIWTMDSLRLLSAGVHSHSESSSSSELSLSFALSLPSMLLAIEKALEEPIKPYLDAWVSCPCRPLSQMALKSLRRTSFAICPERNQALTIAPATFFVSPMFSNRWLFKNPSQQGL